MTLRRKLAVTTIAASVAMSAFAGIPFSNKGLAEKLGVSGVVYATSYSAFVTEAGKIYAELAKGDGSDLQKVNAFRSQIASALEDGTILAPIIAEVDPSVQTIVEELIEEILTYEIDANWQTKLNSIRAEYSSPLKAVYPGLETDELAAFFLVVERDVAAVVANATLEDLLDTASLKQQLKTAVQNAIDGNDVVKAFFEDIEITGNDLVEVLSAIYSHEDVNILDAADAFAALNRAYKAAHAPANPDTNNPTPNPNPGTTIDIPQEAKDLENKLNELKDKLADASDEEKAELIAEAVAETKSVVDKLASIANTVTVAEGKTTVQLDESKTLSAIAGIGSALASLKAATGEELPAPTITIDLGEVAEDEVAIGLSDAIVEEAVKAGLGAVALKVGGLTVELPFGGTISKGVDFSVKQSDPEGTVPEGSKVLSKVYDFNIAVDGQDVTQFIQSLTLSLPVIDITGVDTDLLTLAKLVQERLQYYVGQYNAETGQVSGLRDSLSSYVIVENRVSFDDTDSVASWAGRAIEVIAAKGAINGKAEGVFAPGDQVTRAEFAKMLVHALSLNSTGATEGFADVNASDWFAPYVATAVKHKVINGRSETVFDPHAKITRAEMATMISRALKAARGAEAVEDIDAALSVFSDAGQISASLQEGVAFAAEHGIVIGNEGKFSPNSNATRAQAAVIIYRAFNFE